jgi:adenylyltransferase/sulfurtransferase
MTPDKMDRYSRQIRFVPLGAEGQERILRAQVAIVGCGALGSFQAGAMARAGVGRLVLVDRDYVEESNLQRQWLYDEDDALEARPKAIAAAAHLKKIASRCRVTAHVSDLTSANVGELLDGSDLILDGTDNFETRYLLNDYAVSRGVPWIYGAAVGSYGLTMPVIPGVTACLACVYPEPPGGAQPTCETAGVLGPVTSVVASLQCAAALKLLAGRETEPAISTVDVWSGEMRTVSGITRDPDCRACGQRRFDYLEARQRSPVKLCGRNAVQIHDRTRPVDLGALRAQLEPLGPIRANEFALRFSAAPYELTVFADGRAIVKGTEDAGVARSVYARFVGS